MPEDWLAVTLRFALYLDLMVLFGVSLFSLYALGPTDPSSGIFRLYSRMTEASALAGIVLSIWDVVAMAESMSGATRYSELTSHVFDTILTGTAVGAAWLVRLAVLAAGAVVSKDVQPYTVVGGIPAKFIRERFTRTIAERLTSIAWWDWPFETIMARLADFQTSDIEAFCERWS